MIDAVHAVRQSLGSGDAPRAIAPIHRLRGNIPAAAFASDLEDLITRHHPELWVHGHVHQNRDYLIGTTWVLANATGSDWSEDSGFVEDLVAEVGEAER